MRVAIIDYEMGNMFSVKNALETVGIQAEVTRDKEYIQNADGLILPGVGAFKSGMEQLIKHGLPSVIEDFINAGKPFMGICLGFQLLFTESEEFGKTRGLDIIKGKVIRFPDMVGESKIRIPQISWNRINKAGMDWDKTELKHIKNGEYMYFVHSYYVVPGDESIVLTTTNYHGVEYCSSIKKENIFAVQFHPEKSGIEGIKIYEAFKGSIEDYKKGVE